MIEAQDKNSAMRMSCSDRFKDWLKGLCNSTYLCSFITKKTKLGELWAIKQRTKVTNDAELNAILFFSAISNITIGNNYPEIVSSRRGENDYDFCIAQKPIYHRTLSQSTQGVVSHSQFNDKLKNQDNQLAAFLIKEQQVAVLNTLTDDLTHRTFIKNHYDALSLHASDAFKKLLTLADIHKLATQEKQQTMTIKFSDGGHMDFCIDAIVIHCCVVSEKTRALIQKHYLHKNGTLKNTEELHKLSAQLRALPETVAATILQKRLFPLVRKFNRIINEKREIAAKNQQEIQKEISAIKQEYEEILQSSCVGLPRERALSRLRRREEELKSKLEFAKFARTTSKGKEGSLTWYHDVSCYDEKKYRPMYAPNQQIESNYLFGGHKHVTHLDNKFVVLVPNNTTEPFMGKNFRKLAGLPGIIPGIAVDPHHMIALNGGSDFFLINHPVAIDNFAKPLKVLPTLHRLRMYCLDFKAENVVWKPQPDGTGVASIIDVDDIVSIESAGKWVSFSPEATTGALIDACFNIVNNQVKTVNPCFKEGDPKDNSHYFNAWQQYSFARVMMIATTKNRHLKEYLYVPYSVNALNLYRDRKEEDPCPYYHGPRYPGILNVTSEALFTPWIKEHIKPEYEKDYRQLMSNPAKYAEHRRTDMPDLDEMIKGIQTT